jgi:hypothetical protein
MTDLNLKIESFLEQEYSKIFDLGKYSTYRVSDCGPHWIGAMLSHMIHCSNLSYQYGFVMNVSSNDNWKMVPHGKFSTVFNSISELDDSNFGVNNFSKDNKNNRISYTVNRPSLDNSFSKEMAYFYPKGLENLVETTDILILSDIWKSFLLKKIYKLNDTYKNYLEEKLTNINGLNDYAAIHIRRGDKVKGPMKESNFIETKQYFDILEKSDYKGNNIFISTDSPDALNECISLYGNKYNLLYDNTEIRHDGYPYKVIVNSLNITETSHEELITAFKNFEILKNSNVLVGTPASWFFRISMLLRPYTKIKDVIYSEDLKNIPGYPEAYWHS